jgi:Na+-transporting NADH:ubiquinone oxidoreductase subunit B
MMLAILFMNVFAPFLDHLVVQENVKRRQERLAAA